jgi:hypothetical protein
VEVVDELECPMNGMAAFALPQWACCRLLYCECDELNMGGFALPVLYLEKLACSPVLRAAAESSRQQIFQEWNLLTLMYETADEMLWCNLVDSANHIGLLTLHEI